MKKIMGMPVVLAGLIAAIVGVIGWYVFLPALNIKSLMCWALSVFTLLVFTIIHALLKENKVVNEWEEGLTKKMFIVIAAIVVILGVLVVFSSPIFNAKKYSNLLEVKDVDMDEYAPSIDSVPLLDKDSALLLANRRMGSLEDVVSQFVIRESIQIVQREKPMRVSVLDYSGFFKWLNNKDYGTPGYVVVDMQTQRAELVRVDGGIRYSKSEFFGRDINRHIRFQYPTLLFGDMSFELDDSNNPYWIVPILDKTIGLFGGQDVVGVLTVDAITGETIEYAIKNSPNWIDNIYSSKMAISQYNYHGKFKYGFINSIFGQKGVRVTTEGYNYIPQGDDVWMYTGVTSVVSDESNIGFIMFNKRTKETLYYQLPGAEEYSAMASAEGVVQHLGYKSTFPLLLMVDDQPTYIVSLKDAGGLVKMYGMINVQSFQMVATGNTIDQTYEKYIELLVGNGIEVKRNDYNFGDNEIVVEEVERMEIIGVVAKIIPAVKNGNTHFYIGLEGNEDMMYELSIVDNPSVILVNEGEAIKISIDAKDVKKAIISGKMK